MRRSTASFWMLGITALTAAALWTWPVERWETVQTVRVALGSVEKTVSVVGTAARAGEYASAHPVGGVVVQVYVREGQAVSAGQPLYRLDDSGAQAALSRAVRALSDIREEEAAAAFVQGSPSGYADTAAELSSRIDSLTAEIAGLTQRAFRDGQVLEVKAREGELLLPGSPGAVLAATEAEIRAEVNARDRSMIREGMRARITQNSLPLGEAAVAKVGLLKPDSLGVPYAQVVLTPSDGLSVPIGAQVEVDVILKEKTQVPVIPVEALTGRDTVFEVYRGRAFEKSLSILLLDSAYAAVGNVAVGTELVLKPNDALSDGVRLKVVRE